VRDRTQQPRRQHPQQERDDRRHVRQDVAPVMADGCDPEEDDVAGHRIGEDMAVVEVNDGVQQPSGRRQQHSRG